eukprot:sb/3472476/
MYITFCTQCKRAIYALHCRAYMEMKCTTAQLECISYLYCTSETSAIYERLHMPCRTLLNIYSARKHMTRSKTIKLGDYTEREVSKQERKRESGCIFDRLCVGDTVSVIFCVSVCDYGVKTLREHSSYLYPATSISARSRRSRVQISSCKWSRGAGVIFALAVYIY